MTDCIPLARATRPGVAVFLFVTSMLVLACGQKEPAVPAGPRTWEGGSEVSSSGVITYERREIAQKVTVPACITVGSDHYRFLQVTAFPGGGAIPPGLMDTFYRLDRWRLWARPGALLGQPSVFVTVRGSTGTVAEYERVNSSEPCGS